MHTLFELNAAFEQCSFVRDLQCISNTRVPLVKFRHAILGVSVDVSVGVDPTASTALVREWVAQNDRFRPLVLLTKVLLQQNALNVPFSGGLGKENKKGDVFIFLKFNDFFLLRHPSGSFHVCCMVQHFLYHLKLQDGGKENSINGGGGQSDKEGGAKKRGRPNPLTTGSALGPLFLGFLNYYGKFRYDLDILCCDGTTIPRMQIPQIPGAFVIINPLEKVVSNCASSCFRIGQIATFFCACERLLKFNLPRDFEGSNKNNNKNSNNNTNIQNNNSSAISSNSVASRKSNSNNSSDDSQPVVRSVLNAIIIDDPVVLETRRILEQRVKAASLLATEPMRKIIRLV